MIRRHLHQKLPRTQRACAGGLPPSHGICVETDAESRAEPLIITRRYSQVERSPPSRLDYRTLS
jgi:hypothetical protein